MMERQYKYYAFISYSHEDEKWAKWPHRKLESYRLPNTVVREAPVSMPRNIWPVFRDQTDIGVVGCPLTSAADFMEEMDMAKCAGRRLVIEVYRLQQGGDLVTSRCISFCQRGVFWAR